MKIEAKHRLRATKVEALLDYPVSNTSQQGYLTVIANMVIGHRPIGKDCRSVVARYICHNLGTGARIVLVGEDGSNSPFHCLLVNPDGKIVADAYNGKFGGSTYTFTTSTGEHVVGKVLAAVNVKLFMEALNNGEFKQFISKFSK